MKIKNMNRLTNRKGEGTINTGVKIIIGVVIGGVILAGLFVLIGGEDGILAKAEQNVTMMIHMEDTPTETRYDSLAKTPASLQYSFDGRIWFDSEVPAFSEEATVEKYLVSPNDSSQIVCIVLDEGNAVAVASADNGKTFTEVKAYAGYNVVTSLSYTGGKFQARVENDSWIRNITSDDGLTWKDNGLPWMKLTPSGN